MAATEISVDHIARVEGHGDIRLVIEDGRVVTCEMAVVEPARLFESMVRGRSFEEVPYIASRVCGICSSSHVVTDLRAIEQVFGVEVTDRTEALARASALRLLPAEPRHSTCSCSPLRTSWATSRCSRWPRATRSCSSAHWG